MKYPPANVLVQYAYNPKKFLDSMVSTHAGTMLFREVLNYDHIGNILAQKSQHGGKSEELDAYSYDDLNRLISWSSGGNADNYADQYQYDKVGNRLGNVPAHYSSGGSQTEARSYSYTTGKNQLAEVVDQVTVLSPVPGSHAESDEYEYTADGALKKRQHLLGSGMFQSLQKEETFGYSYNGLLKKYTSGQYSGVADWDWRYRYSASGEREQKRSYVVPSNSNGTKAWEYYLLGGDQKQLAVYKGVEAANQCGDNGNYIYLYPVEYNSYSSGGTHTITTRPYDQWNGTREYAVVDHVGSTRVVVNEWGTIKTETDYDAFGEEIQVSGMESRKGFVGKEKDKESGDINMGVRQYDAKTGRFPTPDKLWEKYRSLSPYAYCANNPLKYTDPSGMVLEVVKAEGQSKQ